MTAPAGPILQPTARIAIVNRADAAVRAVHGIRDRNRSCGSDLRSVVFHTDADAGAWFTELADEAYSLGPTRILDPTTQLQTHALLDLGVLEHALEAVRADAVWVGWGFVSERPEFAELCERLGIVFIGPSSTTLRRLGDKVAAKSLAESVGVPVTPWSGGAVEGEALVSAAQRIGFPLMVKAAAGGGGRGIRSVGSMAELESAVASVRAEAASAFGDPTVFLERRIDRARHLEVQVAADRHGRAQALGIRDCSIQRRRQKVIEESGALGLEGYEEQLREHAHALARAAGYVGLGTVEFLFDLDRAELAFMEVNPRLQVEHGVTELTTGLDLVGLQLDIAAGLPLPAEVPPETGHAIEARLTAEAPTEDFRPAPGRLAVVRLPSGPGIRVDSGVREGDVIPPDFDPLVLKVLAHGATRDEAVARLARAVEDTRLVVAGGATTSGFVQQLLDSRELRAGGTDTTWVDRLVEAGQTGAPDGDVALVLAAIDLAKRSRSRDQSHLMSSAARGRPDLVGADGHALQLSLHGVEYAFVVHRTGPAAFLIETPDGVLDVWTDVHRDGSSVVLRIGEQRWDAVVQSTGVDTQVSIAGNTYRIAKSEESGVVRAPVPAVVVQVRAVPGDPVVAGDVLVVLESMKLEVPVRAAVGGVVRDVPITVGSQVDVSDPLVRLEGDRSEGSDARAAAVDFHRLARPTSAEANSPSAGLDILLRALSGFDPGPVSLATVARRLAEAYADSRATEGSPLREGLVLSAFADCVEVTSDDTSATATSPMGTRGSSGRELLRAFLRAPGRSQRALPKEYMERLERTLISFGATGLDADENLEDACYRLCCAQRAMATAAGVVTLILHRLINSVDPHDTETVAPTVISRLSTACEESFPAVAEAARALAHKLESASGHRRPITDPDTLTGAPEQVRELLERVLRDRYGEDLGTVRPAGADAVVATSEGAGGRILASYGVPAAGLVGEVQPTALEVLLPPAGTAPTVAQARALVDSLGRAALPGSRATVTGLRLDGAVFDTVAVLERTADGWHEPEVQGVHPAVARQLELWRWREFTLDLLAVDRDVYLFRAVARSTDADTRLVLMVDVRDLEDEGIEDVPRGELPGLENLLLRSLDMMRAHVSGAALRNHGLTYNRIVLYVRPLWTVDDGVAASIMRRVVPAARNLGIEQVLIRVTSPVGPGETRDRLIHISRLTRTGMSLGESVPSDAAVRPLSARQLRIIRLRRRGIYDPWEIVDLLTSPQATLSDFPPGTFQELELDASDHLVPIERPRGDNPAGVVVGLASNRTPEHPDGLRRVVILGDPHRGLGALAEPECRRILAALHLAHTERLPLEWFALSSGARISMTSGTENMDWVARVLRAIVELTQDGLEINIVVAGVNVGAQPYFNAESTMLMHTRGILVMIPTSSMVLTGKEALDFAGGVSAEDNLGIGGYDRVMGPNGQAQYWAHSLESACSILFQHYDHTYVSPGESRPRPRVTSDPVDRDVREAPHAPVDGVEFTRVGDIFSDELNPGRKKPYDMRSVMDAVVDDDCSPLERWAGMAGAESAIVCDAHVGGRPVCLVGIESRSLPRRGIVPADGPESWTGATLFPRSSKKIARAINAASGNRPVVVLANLAGFDGSPESLRELQLEFGAEIGRAVTNFEGRMVFCVLSRYHGGAFVVFSKSLNENLEVIAVEGAQASVIGGSAAAAVIFGREVAARVADDPRMADVEPGAPGYEDLHARVTADVRAAVAREFDDTHTIERAKSVGSVDRIVSARHLRAEIISSIGD